MKKLITIFLTIIITFSMLTGCQINNATEKDPVIYPVTVQKLQLEKTDETLYYVGTIVADDLVKYSFKSGGKLEQVMVQKGDKVVGGTVLAALDKSDLQLSVNAARAQMDAAKAVYNKAVAGASEEDKNNAKLNLQKAQNAYDYAKDNMDRIEKLFKAGGVSQSEYEGAQLDLEIKKASLEQAQELYNQVTKGARQEDIDAAKANYEQAKTNYQHKQKQYNETTLSSEISGYAAEVLFEAGEIVGAGYPVVVVRSENQVVNVGLSQQDVNNVEVGDKTKVKIGDTTVDGIVTLISEMPNQDTRTYDTEIALLDGKFRLGMVADVQIVIGEFKGIWIPIDNVMFSGEDFVFIVNEDKIERRSVKLLETRGSRVLVEGLTEGELLVIANSGQVKPGDKVRVVSE